jgi:WD40 repeat protein
MFCIGNYRGYVYSAGLALVVAGWAWAQPIATDALPLGAVARVGNSKFQLGTHLGTCVYSPDGKKLATVAENKVCLWDVATGKITASFIGRDPAFSPDGKYLGLTLAVGPENFPDFGQTRQIVVVYEVGTGKEFRRLDTPKGSADSLAFAPDGKAVAVGLYGGRLQTFDWPAGNLQTAFTRKGNYQVGEHRSVAYAPDGKTAVSIFHGSLILWDIAGAAVLTQTTEGGIPLYLGASFTADGKYLYVGDATGAVTKREFAKPLTPLPGVPGANRNEMGDRSCVSFSSDGKYAAMAFIPNTSIEYPESGWLANTELRLFELATGKVTVLDARAQQIAGLAFAPDGRTLAVTGVSGRVAFWDLATKKENGVTDNPQGPLFAVAMAPDGKTLATAGADRKIYLYEYPSGKALKPLEGHEFTVVALAFAPDNKRLAACDRGGVYKVWDLGARKELLANQFPVEQVPVFGSMRWTDDGTAVAIQGLQVPVLVNVGTGEATACVSTRTYSADAAGLTYFLPSYWLSPRSTPRKFPTFYKPNERPTRPVDAPPQPDQNLPLWSTMVLSPDHSTIVAAYADTLRLYRPQDGSEHLRLLPKADSEERRPRKRIRQIGYTPDGKNLVVVQDSEAVAYDRGGSRSIPPLVTQTIRVFDTQSWVETKTFQGHGGRTNALVLHKRYALTANHDATVLVWDLDAPGLAKPALAGNVEALWQVVIGDDQEAANEALPVLAKNPQAVCAHVETLFNTPGADAEVDQALKDLGNADFVVRFKALQNLTEWRKQRVGTELAIARYILRAAGPESGRQQARMLLEGMVPGQGTGGINYTRDRDKLYRLMLLLEKTGGAEARGILQRCVDRLPLQRGSENAAKALDRMAQTNPAATTRPGQ